MNLSKSNQQTKLPRAWGPAWLQKRRAERLTSIEQVSPPPKPPAATSSGDSHAYNEECWKQVTQQDYAYLNGPRSWPLPCPWCGGRLRHSQACHELTKSWEPTMPFGKHKGRPISEVPKDYLYWLITRGGLDSELQAAIQGCLSGGNN